jgi:hypothetical protein
MAIPYAASVAASAIVAIPFKVIFIFITGWISAVVVRGPNPAPAPTPANLAIATPVATVPPSDATPSLPLEHVMFSYSHVVNKDLIVKLAVKLRSLGYDIWRDEEDCRRADA